ncbi:MAG TPA: hypothetical protein HPP83_13175 [Candidatus Hydrogenedentes bacterium]|nr:hypothetical protein [Candidatus Hydrogenedentota bacterium]
MTTDREWIERTLGHEETGAVPYNFMFSPPAARRVKSHYGDDLEAALALPIRMTAPDSVKPLYASPQEFGDTLADEFGVVWSTSEIDRGAPIGPCLDEPMLLGYSFPDPGAAYRLAHIAEWCAGQVGHYRIIWVGDLWERATFMRGMGDLLTDVALHPAFVEALLYNLTEYILETMRILFGLGDFEGVALSDDYGTQKGLVMAPDSWRRFIKPCLAKIYGLAKENGRSTFLHSCGNIVSIIGDLIDVGLDILHPIQPEAMDILELKREFGNRLTFCGGVATQTLLVSGTPEEVRGEVQRLKREMGRGGGYILEPGITLQDDVPLDNMVAMIDEAMRRDA